MLLCFALAGCFSGIKRYVGSNENYEVIIELKNDNTFKITEKDLYFGLTTIRDGTYEYLDSNESVIKFIFSENGYSFNCKILTNIYGTPFIPLFYENNDYPACYLE